MSDFRHRTLATNGIEMHVTEAGDPDAKPVILVHGFPELGRSWRKQLPALADAGYRAIAPDMRGYGKSAAPKQVEAYRVTELCKDLCGLLDDIGAEKAAFVGHDWGAWAMWFMSLLHPERVDNLTNLSVAYAPRSATPPIQTMRQIFGDIFFYMVYFQDVGPAETELEADVRRTVLRFAWSVSGAARQFADPSRMTMKYGEGGFLDQLSDPPDGLASIPWFTQSDLDHFVESFSRSGYFGPVSWYRNIDRNWEDTPQLADARPSMPVLFIAGTNDPVLTMLPPDPMRETVADLRGIVLVEGAGHWVHMEQPDDVNGPLLKFLADVGY
jgi:pimeloyl-ACP methyl ester carboxylesterase